MAPLKKDSDIESYTKACPLILIPDTPIQRAPSFNGTAYPPPCLISRKNFQIIQNNVYLLSIQAGFEFTGHPAYHIFNDERFRGHRRSFWQPVLRSKLPIYIISPLFGVMWPGDRFGPYDLLMEDVFIIWKQKQVWKLILEFYERNGCDCVISYLPPIYDNIVRVEETPWFMFKPYDLIEHMQILLKIARKSPYKAKTPPHEEIDAAIKKNAFKAHLRQDLNSHEHNVTGANQMFKIAGISNENLLSF